MTKLRSAVFVALLFVCAVAQAQTPRRFAFRAAHYDVTAALAPVDQMLSARARVEFEAREASRVVETELHPNLKVTAVLGADGKPASFERDAANPLVLRVTLPQPATVGQKVTLTFDYSGPLAGEEGSPVKSVRLASINRDAAYLLLPAR